MPGMAMPGLLPAAGGAMWPGAAGCFPAGCGALALPGGCGSSSVSSQDSGAMHRSGSIGSTTIACSGALLAPDALFAAEPIAC